MLSYRLRGIEFVIIAPFCDKFIVGDTLGYALFVTYIKVVANTDRKLYDACEFFFYKYCFD